MSKTHIYNTAEQVIAWVEKQFGVTYTLLKRLGFTYKENRLVPGKADPEAQRQFVRWFEKVRAELGPDDRIYFSDAVHAKHNAEAGYAWGTNVGWIKFDPKDGGVTIDPATGSFDGYAWGENVGWIHFKNAAPAYNVVTTFRPPVVGGVTEPVSPLVSSWPWITLVAVVGLGTVVAAAFRKRRKWRHTA